MKLVIIGGGGVRAPMLVAAATRRAARVGLRELWLLDVDRRKLEVFGTLAQQLALASGSGVTVHPTLDADRALDGAAYVVTTIRVGGDRSRVLDERIALRHGVLGQETTGAGGFAMAMRTVPVLLEYAELLRTRSPEAWLLNFTNPAGLVIQSLVDSGFERAVGICDSANLAQHAVAEAIGVDAKALRAEVFGLNHLSWTRRVASADGDDLLAARLRDEEFVGSTMQRFFEPALRERTAMWMSEYLFYWYYAERAVAAVASEGRTRGEEVQALNGELVAELEASLRGDVRTALDRYSAYDAERQDNYMHYADPGGNGRSLGEGGEGYAGVALDVIEALETNVPLYTALNVPNGTAIQGFSVDDVVEISCVVDGDGVRPVRTGPIPEHPAALMSSVKRYERLAARAISERSRDLAIDALMSHPLVLSFSRARGLVDDYLEAHRPWDGR
jgi:alpha-galactosidase/6-phospho-beta-glucosidase family protein